MASPQLSDCAVCGIRFLAVYGKTICDACKRDQKVNQPAHYKSGDLEAIDVIENFDLGFHLGNVVKYILRAGKKDDIVLDLKKARWYLDRHIENVTRPKGGR